MVDDDYNDDDDVYVYIFMYVVKKLVLICFTEQGKPILTLFSLGIQPLEKWCYM